MPDPEELARIQSSFEQSCPLFSLEKLEISLFKLPRLGVNLETDSVDSINSNGKFNFYQSMLNQPWGGQFRGAFHDLWWSKF